MLQDHWIQIQWHEKTKYHRGSVKIEEDSCVRSTRFLIKFLTFLVYEMACGVIILVCICLLIIQAKGREICFLHHSIFYLHQTSLRISNW